MVWCELFQELDIAALEQALSGWAIGEAAVSGHVASVASGCVTAPRLTLRATHLLAAFSARLQGVIGHLQVAPAIDVKTLHAKIGELTLENDFVRCAHQSWAAERKAMIDRTP